MQVQKRVAYGMTIACSLSVFPAVLLYAYIGDGAIYFVVLSALILLLFFIIRWEMRIDERTH